MKNAGKAIALLMALIALWAGVAWAESAESIWNQIYKLNNILNGADVVFVTPFDIDIAAQHNEITLERHYYWGDRTNPKSYAVPILHGSKWDDVFYSLVNESIMAKRVHLETTPSNEGIFASAQVDGMFYAEFIEDRGVQIVGATLRVPTEAFEHHIKKYSYLFDLGMGDVVPLADLFDADFDTTMDAIISAIESNAQINWFRLKEATDDSEYISTKQRFIREMAFSVSNKTITCYFDKEIVVNSESIEEGAWIGSLSLPWDKIGLPLSAQARRIVFGEGQEDIHIAAMPSVEISTPKDADGFVVGDTLYITGIAKDFDHGAINVINLDNNEEIWSPFDTEEFSLFYPVEQPGDYRITAIVSDSPIMDDPSANTARMSINVRVKAGYGSASDYAPSPLYYEAIEKAERIMRITWTPLKDIAPWEPKSGTNDTYLAGVLYSGLPYGWPLYISQTSYDLMKEKRAAYRVSLTYDNFKGGIFMLRGNTDATVQPFLDALKDPNHRIYRNDYYTNNSGNQSGAIRQCPLYSTDCSSFVCYLLGMENVELDFKGKARKNEEGYSLVSDWADIRPGDLLHITGHIVFVMDVKGDVIVTCEQTWDQDDTYVDGVKCRSNTLKKELPWQNWKNAGYTIIRTDKIYPE